MLTGLADGLAPKERRYACLRFAPNNLGPPLPAGDWSSGAGIQLLRKRDPNACADGTAWRRPDAAAVKHGPHRTVCRLVRPGLDVFWKQCRLANPRAWLRDLFRGPKARLEFEKAPFFDIYDPETEPWYPAPVHTDLKPLVEGQKKVIWLRPQMYESVPYERWR